MISVIPFHLPGTVFHLTYAKLLTLLLSGNDSKVYCVIVYTTDYCTAFLAILYSSALQISC